MRTPLFYGYARVSTSLQSLKNQRHEIFEYAHKNNMLIDYNTPRKLNNFL